jgi:diguanylate cyclase (GGDEF)-like protein/PAS domain S-box-containing protein
MRRLFAALLVALGTLPAWALERVTLQLNWKHQFQFAGYYAAIAQGYYREAGLEVELAEVQEGIEPIDAVLGGRAQFGVGASELALRRGRGDPVVALATILQHSPLLLLAGAGTDSIHELAGKRVMLLAHETELYAYLQREGIALSALQEVPHSFNIRDLIEGRVDAVSAYQTDEPFVLRQAGFRYKAFTPRSVGVDFYGDTLFTRADLVRQKPQLVRAFREASIRGWRYAMDHPTEVADMILARYGQRHSREHLLFEAAEMARLMQPDLVEIGHMSPGRWQHVADTYAELGMLPGGTQLEGFLYDAAPARLPAWILPAFLAAGLLLLALAALALRFRYLNRQVARESAARQALLLELHATQRDMMALIDATPGAAMLIDRGGTLLAMNGTGAARFGLDKDEIIGRNIFDLVPEDIRDARRQAVGQAVENKRSVVIEDGRAGRLLHNTIVPVEDEDGTVRRIAVFSEDVTERRQAEQARREAHEQLQAQLAEIRLLQAKLAEMAIRDGLTDLFNRRYLDETLEREIARARREGHPLSLVMIDLDRFKEINDTYGHQAGDEVLKALADQLRHQVRAEDVPCRYGGEEFLILLPGMPLAAATERAEGWRVDFAGQVVRFGEFELRNTASFGVASYPEHGKHPDELTRCADQALYRAKAAGRNRVVAYTGGD